MLTSEEALYCLVICYDDSRNIEQKKGKLDDPGGGGGDAVSLMLDTFGDERTAYNFAVSAAGVRSDCRLLDDARNRDYSWDGIWFSEARVYVVEMQIPYKSIQYDESLSSWGLDFDRWVAMESEDQYWCPFEESEGQRVSRFGHLQFEEFRPTISGLNLELYPVAISKATYIDDNTYESYFSERRPFFTEGNEVFIPSGTIIITLQSPPGLTPHRNGVAGFLAITHGAIIIPVNIWHFTPVLVGILNGR